ncbi:hypothetical protein PO654_23690 [Phytobacter diazotrophicus]|uniref:hypothetical protein n=1 Tax=Phytobacter diazotrophicus TaxID=395631 RepID=UPI0013EDB84D|nr:hypothetical protein [Phytobacter diazotrophicus]MDU7131734.1 hypothetical protein [Enterobacteriaceae bacterium]QIH63398.1 hypothetical protein CRX67_09860 [Enterobacteriaceae bacterium A-F18]
MKATKEQVFEKLESLTTDAHQFACSLNIGAQRTEAFQIYEVLRRLQRRGAAAEILAATNPLFASTDCDEDDD